MPFNTIGKAIHAVGDKYKYGVVKMFVGHGVGTVFHAFPHILHYRWGSGEMLFLWECFFGGA